MITVYEEHESLFRLVDGHLQDIMDVIRGHLQDILNVIRGHLQDIMDVIRGHLQDIMDVIRGHLVVQLVEALHYKPEGRRFDSRWCHWIFSLT